MTMDDYTRPRRPTPALSPAAPWPLPGRSLAGACIDLRSHDYMTLYVNLT